jgi:cell division protein FtsW
MQIVTPPAVRKVKKFNISKYCDAGLTAAVLFLSVFGIAMIYSASKYNAAVYYDDEFYYASKQLIGLFLGLTAMGIMYFCDYKYLRRFAPVIYIAAVALLLLVFVPGVGMAKLGASRWIGFGGFSIQPSEIAKFAFIIFAAHVFTSAENKELNNAPTLRQTFLVLIAGGIICGLIILEPNMSITVCVGVIMFIMLFLCGVKLKTLGWIILPALILAAAMLAAEPYRLKRLSAFVDPWANPKDEGFQLIQSLYSIGNGGLFGIGFGNSQQKYMFLPFSESDFIFSIFAEEFGLLGCLWLFAVFGYIIYKIFKIGFACKDRFGKYLCFGIAVVIFTQSALNFCVAAGCLPPTGLPLPFISFGGTSLLVFMAAIGIVLNINRQIIQSHYR